MPNPVPAPNPFNAEEVKSQIATESYQIDDGKILVITKNNSKYNIDLTIDCLFYKDGRLIGTTSEENYCFESGRECALRLYGPMDANANNLEYDSYQLKTSVEESNYPTANASNIICTGDFGSDNIMVHAVNNGIKASYTNIALVYYKNGNPIGYENRYAEIENPGSETYLQFDSFPRDDDYNAIIPDSFKIFVNYSN